MLGLLSTYGYNIVSHPSDADCYVITYEGSKTLRYVVGGCILLVMFGMFSFPAWPDTPKIYVRDGSRVVLVGMLGTLVPITVLRPIVAGLTGCRELSATGAAGERSHGRSARPSSGANQPD